MDPADQFHADRLLFVVEKKVLGTAHMEQYCNLTSIIACVVYEAFVTRALDRQASQIKIICVSNPSYMINIYKQI